MTILIIGAKGMLGQALAEEFKDGKELFLWDREPSATRGVSASRGEEIDITEAQSVKRKVQNLRPDLVINAAAYNNVDGAESEPEIADKVNGYAVGYLAAICKKLGTPLIHYSTDYVFDGTKKEGYAEEDKPNPISAYGYSKYLGEQELQKNTDKFYLIRLSKLFGKEALSGGGKKSFVKLVLDSFRERKELEVVDEEVSSPTYAPDLAERTKYILEKSLPFGIYHGTNQGTATWYEFAKEIFKILNINVKLNPVPAARVPRPAKRPAYGILLNTKLPATRPWEEALKEFLISNFQINEGSNLSGGFGYPAPSTDLHYQ